MKIKKVHVYPNVTMATLNKDKIYDIAILELEKEVKLTSKVRLLDAIASLSSYPLSVSEWEMLSDLLSVSAIVGKFNFPSFLLAYLIIYLLAYLPT